jgi:hypothetical protein
MHTTFQSKKLKGRDKLKGLGVDGRIILKWIFTERDCEVWTGFNWLRRETLLHGGS